MPKCHICGKKATIHVGGGEWLCKHHYLLLRERAEQYSEANETKEKRLPKIDLDLTRI